MTFEKLGINSIFIEKLKKSGYISPMLVQEKCIPLMLKWENAIIQSPTGSGKTLAYVLPLLENIKFSNNLKYVILVPTKELGFQILTIFKKFTDKILFLPDGVGIKRQIEKLKIKKPNIIISISERFLELIYYKKININNLKALIFDEGDKIFKQKEKIISNILKKIYKTTSIYFFSATFIKKDYDLIKKYRKNIINININNNNKKIQHFYIMINKNKKIQNLFYILRNFNIKKSIVFINRSEGVDSFCKRVLKQKRMIFKLHTKMNSNERKDNLIKFKKEKLSILITTNTFSRGLDIEDIDCVIHYDFAQTKKSYIHRSGRVGRAGKKGCVISFISELEKNKFFAIRSLMNFDIKQIGLTKNHKTFSF